MTVREIADVRGDALMNTRELAEMVKVPETTLRYWRHVGEGPRWFRLGRKSVRYRREDVLTWLEEQYEAGA